MRYYKLDFGDPSQIINDEDMCKFEDDINYLSEIIENEIKHLESKGVTVNNINNNCIVVDNTKIEYKYITPSIITDCDKIGNNFNNIQVEKKLKSNNKRTNIIIDYLKTLNVNDCINKDNLILFSCPICKKNNQKTFIYKNSFKTFSHSATDCNHHEEWNKWKNDLDKIWKESYNPDFSFVKWNENNVIVTYIDESKEEVTETLFKFNEKYKEIEDKPKFKKFVIQPVIENVKCLLNHYDMKLELNIMKMSFEINRDEKLEDYIIKIQDYCTKHGFRITKERLLDSLIYIGKENKYNPINEYLNVCSIKYKNNPSNEEYLKLLDTIETDSEHKEEFIYKFLLQMVYVALNNDKVQHPSQFLLVLQGEQGCGKTTWFKNLIPSHLQTDYFLEGRSFDLGKKDDILESTTTWLTECGEIASTFKKSDQEAFKNFITASKDKFRIPYAKESMVKPRTMSLCATTNDIEYLRDLTGSRRYLTLPTSKINAFHNLDLEMIWGYIYSKYLENDIYWFNQEQISQIISENREFTAKPENIQIIEEYFDLYPQNNDGEWKTAGEIFNNLPFNQKLNKFIVGKELKKCNVKLRIRHKTGYYYVKQIKKSEV